jgi:hypothetical protein
MIQLKYLYSLTLLFASASYRSAIMRLLSLAISFLAFLGSVNAVDPLVDVGNARYLGTALPNGVTQWLGMRFAAPPLGKLRFRTPADPPFVEDVQAASSVTLVHFRCTIPHD